MSQQTEKWQETLIMVVVHLYGTLVAGGAPGQPVSADHHHPGHWSPTVTGLAVDGVGQDVSLGSRRDT